MPVVRKVRLNTIPPQEVEIVDVSAPVKRIKDIGGPWCGGHRFIFERELREATRGKGAKDPK